MKISDILARKQGFSLEIFPPKGDLSVTQARDVAAELVEKDHPDWISVTFSAGGTGNSAHTIDISGAIREMDTTPLAHLTCMGQTKADVDAYIDQLRAHGIENVLALRGDRVPGRELSDFKHASDLVAYLREKDPDLCIGAACYPEGHLESPSLDADIENLKKKVDAGADFLTTQLFFNNRDFYEFRDRCVRAHIKVPIVAGIMPFTSMKQVNRMAFNCGASIPANVVKRLVQAGDDPDDQARAGIEYACEQIRDLAANGVDGIHIYTMNRPRIAHAAHDALASCGYIEA